MLVFGGLQERVALVELLVAGLEVEVMVILGDRDGEGTRSQRGQTKHREHVHVQQGSSNVRPPSSASDKRTKACGPPAKKGARQLTRRSD